MRRRVLELSVAADPLNAIDGGAVGGQQVLIREMVRGLGQRSIGADVVTYDRGGTMPRRSSLGPLSRVVRIGNGQWPQSDADWVVQAGRLADEVWEWIEKEGAKYRLIHSHFWISGMVAQELSRRLEIPWVHSPYKMAKWVHRAGQPLPARRIEIERSLINEVDAVVVAYLEEGELIHADAPRTPLYVIPPPVDSGIFFVRDAGPVLKGLGLKRRPLVYVGRLTDGIGLKGVLKAMSQRQLPKDLVLVVVGGRLGEISGGQAKDPEFAALVQALGSHVQLVGPMPHAAVAQYLSAAETVLAPNQGPTLGLVVIEAMASGRPVVGSRVSGVSDWIIPGLDGLLYEADDFSGMLQGCLSLWNHSERARAMGRAGYEKVHRHHSMEFMTEQLVRVYEEVVNDERVKTGVGD